VKGNANFGRARFANQIDFSGTTFQGNVSFASSQFAGRAYFEKSRFLEHADFISADFQDWADFTHAVFSKYARFNKSVFSTYCDFSDANFKGEICLIAAAFKGHTYLMGAKFDDYTSFYRSEFFLETHFDDAKFLSYVNFNESRFKDYTYFGGTEFRGPVSLNKTKISDWIIDWNSLDGRLVYNDGAYLALLQRLWATGDFDAYDDCYYRYRWLKLLREPFLGDKAIDFMAWATCGFGVRPFHTMAFASVVIILFGLIYWRAELVKGVKGAKGLRGSKAIRSQLENLFVSIEEATHLSILTFLSIIPPNDLNPVGHWKYVFILEYICGWLLMALFLVTIGRLAIR
jgi:uncharacterized protein YjbI with pentapeptide repeats